MSRAVVISSGPSFSTKQRSNLFTNRSHTVGTKHTMCNVYLKEKKTTFNTTMQHLPCSCHSGGGLTALPQSQLDFLGGGVLRLQGGERKWGNKKPSCR